MVTNPKQDVLEFFVMEIGAAKVVGSHVSLEFLVKILVFQSGRPVFINILDKTKLYTQR